MEIDGTMKELHERWEAEEAAKKQALLDEIKKAQDRIAKKDADIEELKFERDLLFGNFLGIINNKLRMSSFNIFMGFNEGMFWKAWRWSAHRDTVEKEHKEGKLDDKEYKETKNCFEMTTRVVKDKFFGNLKDKVKFKEIIMFWDAGYDFTYIYKGQEIIIFVPLFSANEKDYYYALSGYRANYKESEYCQGYIANGLEYKEVAEKLQDWLINEKWKEKK